MKKLATLAALALAISTAAPGFVVEAAAEMCSSSRSAAVRKVAPQASVQPKVAQPKVAQSTSLTQQTAPVAPKVKTAEVSVPVEVPTSTQDVIKLCKKYFSSVGQLISVPCE